VHPMTNQVLGHLVKFQDRSSYGLSGIQHTLDTMKAPWGTAGLSPRIGPSVGTLIVHGLMVHVVLWGR